MAKSQADTLAAYRIKRDFTKTSEPEAKRGKKGGHSFVVQKHAARRTHFDFRLEHDGVLKSWAVTRGPSLNPDDKRLAVRTEDHPLDYKSFEGVIPKDEYGAGPVMIWDEGTWEPLTDPYEGLRRGDLKFRLHGSRLNGEWVLVRMRNKEGENRENWLLIKKSDQYAEPDIDVTERFKTSVKSERTMDGILNAEPAGSNIRKTNTSGKVAGFVEPQLATLVDTPPKGDNWLHEIKFDGYRIIASVAGDDIRFYTRSGHDWTNRFNQLVQEFRALDLKSILIDGEVVVFDENGHSRFSMLQQTLKNGNGEMSFMAFDLLAEGKSLRNLPLHQRKERLRKLLKNAKGSIRYTDHVLGNGDRMYAKACDMDLEGIVSKRADAAYRSGRTKSWLKSKCIGRDEFVIGGWRPAKAKGRPFASLLLGEFDGDELHYRGRVGTGFDQEEMAALAKKMKTLGRKTSPFKDIPAGIAHSARWVMPQLMIEIAYTEQTRDGYLRHPSYLGVRKDKAAKAVEVRPMPETNVSQIAGVGLSSPDKILFPEQGVTKLDLARYLMDHAEFILPHLARRPLSLVRCPEGHGKECFFQKHRRSGFPASFHAVEIREKDGNLTDYLYIDNEAGLVAAAQMGVLELHIWGSHVDKLEKPDRLVFDLDPAEDVGFPEVRNTASDLREVLEAAGLQSFLLVTGGKGVHIVVPLDRRQDWDIVKRFAAGLARSLAEAEPDRYTAKAAKSGRNGRIFIDWLRNERGATAIAPYSPRARSGAPVATPVSWDNLRKIPRADYYAIDTISQRLKRLKADPWDGYFAIRQSITKKALAVVERH